MLESEMVKQISFNNGSGQICLVLKKKITEMVVRVAVIMTMLIVGIGLVKRWGSVVADLRAKKVLVKE